MYTLFPYSVSFGETRDRQSLTPEQSTLLEDTWKSFIKGGANLESAAQKRFQEIAMELSQLGLKFDETRWAICCISSLVQAEFRLKKIEEIVLSFSPA